MTGSIGSTKLLMSNLTLAALDDQGYEVDYSTADMYDGSNTYMDNSVDGCCKPDGWDSRKYLRRLNSNHNNNKSKRHLSEEGRAKAVAHGRKVLETRRLPPGVPREQNGIRYVGDRSISVIIEENGTLHEVGVAAVKEPLFN